MGLFTRILMLTTIVVLLMFAVAIETNGATEAATAAQPKPSLQVEFANSSGDWRGEAFHVNLGLDVSPHPWPEQTEDELLVALRYRPKSNIGFGIPDQVMPITVDVTVTGYKQFAVQEGDTLDWSFNNHLGPKQAGTITVTDPTRLTVEGLEIRAHNKPAGLQFTKRKADAFPLVFTRQYRHDIPITEGPYAGLFDDFSNWQHNFDIGRQWKASESDVVRQHPDGTIEVIYSCIDVPAICAAHEARVSPDGSLIAFIVSRTYPTARKWEIWAAGRPEDTGLWDFKMTTSEIWIYDVASRKKYKLTSGHIDRGVEWYSNGILVFGSDRDGFYPPLSKSFSDGRQRNFLQGNSQQLFRGILKDGQLTDITNISPDQYFIQSPAVLSNGDICYSSAQGFFPRDFGTTPVNKWPIECRDINGRNIYAELDWHGGLQLENYALIKDWVDPLRKGENASILKGTRGVAELFKRFLALTSYYAKNSGGQAGAIFGWWTDFGFSEGVLTTAQVPATYKDWTQNLIGSGRFMPDSIRPMTPWALDQDMDPKFHQDGRAAGRAGHPSPFPNHKYGTEGRFFATKSDGHCYEAARLGTATVKAMGGELPCRRKIVASLGPDILNPFDAKQMEVVACADPKYHCYDQRWLGPYVDFWGQVAPKTTPIIPPDERCFLEVDNARNAELFPIPGKEDEQSRIDFQGNAHPDYAAIVTHFGVEHFDHWKTLPTREGVNVTRTIKAPLNPDGSVQVEVECGKPFHHHGYDADGNKVASGVSPFACFGVCKCAGCHDGHSTSRALQLHNLVPVGVRGAD